MKYCFASDKSKTQNRTQYGFANFTERLLETILKRPEINYLCVSKKVDELVFPKVMILNMT